MRFFFVHFWAVYVPPFFIAFYLLGFCVSVFNTKICAKPIGAYCVCDMCHVVLVIKLMTVQLKVEPRDAQ